MTFVEKQTDPSSPLHWRGNMQADYLYTSGVAGDRLFKHIMKKIVFLHLNVRNAIKRFSHLECTVRIASVR